jgi:hypothetical protein
MVICGSYMDEFSVSKGYEKKLTMIKGERRWHEGRWRCIYI